MLKWAGVLEALKEAQFYGIYAQELLFSQKKKVNNYFAPYK